VALVLAGPAAAQAQAPHPVCGASAQTVAPGGAVTGKAPAFDKAKAEEVSITKVTVAATDAGTTADVTPSSTQRDYTVTAAPAAQGRAFAVSVNYEVQKFQQVRIVVARDRAVLRWRPLGPAVPHSCSFNLAVGIQPLASYTTMEEAPVVPLPGVAKLSEAKNADVASIVPVAGGLQILPNKVGAAEFSLPIKVNGIPVPNAKLNVYVVGSGPADGIAVTVAAGQATSLHPADFSWLAFRATARAIDGVTSVAQPKIAEVVAARGVVRVIGNAAGHTTGSAVYESRANASDRAKVKLSIFVLGTTGRADLAEGLALGETKVIDSDAIVAGWKGPALGKQPPQFGAFIRNAPRGLVTATVVNGKLSVRGDQPGVATIETVVSVAEGVWAPATVTVTVHPH
jgi:hypothetical protein